MYFEWSNGAFKRFGIPLAENALIGEFMVVIRITFSPISYV